jgi:hypothetical protein
MAVNRREDHTTRTVHGRLLDSNNATLTPQWPQRRDFFYPTNYINEFHQPHNIWRRIKIMTRCIMRIFPPFFFFYLLLIPHTVLRKGRQFDKKIRKSNL